MTYRSLVLTVSTLGLVLLLAACGGAATPTTAPAAGKTAAAPTTAAKTGTAAPKTAGDAGRGAQLFTQSCSSCHGQDAKGLPGLGKDMTTSAFVKSQSDAQLLDFIKKGRPVGDPANTTKVDMPPKGGNPALTDAQLMDIIAYMRTLQQ